MKNFRIYIYTAAKPNESYHFGDFEEEALERILGGFRSDSAVIKVYVCELVEYLKAEYTIIKERNVGMPDHKIP